MAPAAAIAAAAAAAGSKESLVVPLSADGACLWLFPLHSWEGYCSFWGKHLL